MEYCGVIRRPAGPFIAGRAGGLIAGKLNRRALIGRPGPPVSGRSQAALGGKSNQPAVEQRCFWGADNDVGPECYLGELAGNGFVTARVEFVQVCCDGRDGKAKRDLRVLLFNLEDALVYSRGPDQHLLQVSCETGATCDPLSFQLSAVRCSSRFRQCHRHFKVSKTSLNSVFNNSLDITCSDLC